MGAADQTGRLVDQAQVTADRDAYSVHLLLGRKVMGTRVDAPKSIALRFDSGHELEVFDSSPNHELFTVQPGDLIV